MSEANEAPSLEVKVAEDEEEDGEKEEDEEKDGGYVEQTLNLESEVRAVHSVPPGEYDKPLENHHDEESSKRLKGTINNEKSDNIGSDLNLILINNTDKKLENDIVGVETDRKNKCNSESERGEYDEGRRVNEDEDDVDSIPPALPPRPPRHRQPCCACTCGMEDTAALEERIETRVPRSCWSNGLRKYVFLCTACGSLSILLGALFLTVYFMLKSYTSSLNHFETIPTYVPSGMLVATGFLIICLAWRKNRNSFLMKLCGLCSLCCAVLCVSVTVTTTVIHMNRLQTLRECLYTQKTQSCTCYSVLIDNNRISDEGIKFVFNSTPDCEVIHGALYSCLRAIFGLSVIGILVCIFSCMLVYQLLSHEKKKMYWAQLEMRCRYLYRQQRNPHYYACCDECRYPPHPQLFPWELMRNRFWSTGRIGNLYTPNPEDRGNHNRLRSGWNWRRLPWNRNGSTSGGIDGPGDPTRGNLGSPDSQYGFSSTVEGAPYTVLDPRTTAGIPVCGPPAIPGADITEGGFYSWGPPPPYASNRNSANNSPARRSLGELLNHVSPVRRNDNVSPVRSGHHIHRHHVHHARRCSSSPRQITTNNPNQSDSYQKATPIRNSTLTDIIHQGQQQQQMGMNPLWSNSLSSVHRAQKLMTNKDNYENMYETEGYPQSNGFNTLPSLKKKNNQTRVNDVFSNEPFTAYFFSSADNLGCSTSNMGPQGSIDNETLPMRMHLTNEQPNTSRNGPSGGESVTSKSSNDLDVSSQPSAIYGTDLIPMGPRMRSTQSGDRNTSLVKKLLVNCSPTKQRPHKSSHDLSPYPFGKTPDTLMQTPKKSFAKMTGDQEESSAEGSNENVITLHYRVGIPRSPNVQNFGQLPEKGLGSYHWMNGVKDGSGSESWSNDRTSNSEMTHGDNHAEKMSKSVKYIVRDMELLQKHNSLIKEFKTLDIGRSLKCKDNKHENRKGGGIENSAYQQSEDSTKDLKQHFTRSHHSGRENASGIHSPKIHEMRTGKPETGDEFFNGNLKTIENESDVYFGDTSNSSCYGPDSLNLQEESTDDVTNHSRYSSGDHSSLNKKNFKMTDVKNSNYNERSYESHPNGKPEPSSYKRYPNGYRHMRLGPQYPIDHVRGEKSGDSATSKSELFEKDHRRPIAGSSHYKEPSENHIKYFQPVTNHGFVEPLNQHDYRQESITSADEHSSSSLTTADSGISTDKNYNTKRFDNAFHDVGPGPREPGGKASGFDCLNEFSHPLFQKPKLLPKINRYKDTDISHEKKRDVEDSESGNELEIGNQKTRTRSFGKVKNYETIEEVSNQLLNACNLSLNPRYLNEETHQIRNYSGKHDGSDQTSVQSEEGIRKSPKPLPRTNLPNKSSEEDNENDHDYPKPQKSIQKREKIISNGFNTTPTNHFLAPDAQYEFQGSYNHEIKLKTHSKHGEQGSGGRMKPPISAKSPLLQEESKKGTKIDGISVHVMGRGNDGVRPTPRRRRNGPETSEVMKDVVEMGAHSVNV